ERARRAERLAARRPQICPRTRLPAVLAVCSVNALDQDRWAALWQAAGASGDPLPWFRRLAAAYAEPHRNYHNQWHIRECLAEFDDARHLARHAETVEL